MKHEGDNTGDERDLAELVRMQKLEKFVRRVRAESKTVGEPVALLLVMGFPDGQVMVSSNLDATATELSLLETAVRRLRSRAAAELDRVRSPLEGGGA